jgi:small subunit ribosomal protein S21
MSSSGQIPGPGIKVETVKITVIRFKTLNYSLIFAHRKIGLKYQGGINNMLIIDSKDCENIDKALKKYKKKFEKSKTLLKLRELQSFTKPSVKRRGEVLKAIYRQNIVSGKIEK